MYILVLGTIYQPVPTNNIVCYEEKIIRRFNKRFWDYRFQSSAWPHAFNVLIRSFAPFVSSLVSRFVRFDRFWLVRKNWNEEGSEEGIPATTITWPSVTKMDEEDLFSAFDDDAPSQVKKPSARTEEKDSK